LREDYFGPFSYYFLAFGSLILSFSRLFEENHNRRPFLLCSFLFFFFSYFLLLIYYFFLLIFLILFYLFIFSYLCFISFCYFEDQNFTDATKIVAQFLPLLDGKGGGTTEHLSYVKKSLLDWMVETCVPGPPPSPGLHLHLTFNPPPSLVMPHRLTCLKKSIN
jgi:hypothetical protein